MRRRLIHFLGLARAGNHPVLHWLRHEIAAAGEVTVFYNFINRPLAWQAADGWRDFRPRDRPELHWGPHVAGPPEAPQTVLLSCEDLDLMQAAPPLLTNEADFGDGVQTILLLRDCFNYFASRYGRCLQTGTPFDVERHREMWKQYAREYLGRTKFCGLPYRLGFNNWVADREYRVRIAEDFGFPLRDLVFAEPSVEGGGSTFGNQRVLDHWRLMLPDAGYRRLFDAEMYELNTLAFGDTTAGAYPKEFQ